MTHAQTINTGSRRRSFRCRYLGVFVSAMMFAVAGAHAAQSSTSFSVVVNAPGTAGAAPETCTLIGAFGSSVSVSCLPGDVRFMVQAPEPGFPLSPVLLEESQAGGRIGTYWRKVKVDKREYFEMMVRW